MLANLMDRCTLYDPIMADESLYDATIRMRN